jgi:ABC-type polysaccharide/polyol phosphate export permease
MTKETANNSNITIFSSTQNSYMASARDLLKGFAFWRLWNLLAWNTLNLRFKRSWLGLWWISLSFAVFAIVKIFIFGPVMREEIAFFGPFLVIGFLFYRFASNFIIGGSSVFINAASWIKSEKLPVSVHLYRLISHNLILFTLTAIPSIFICLFLRTFNPLILFILPLVILTYVVNGLCVSIILGVICTRYRDLMHLITTVMQVMFFITPILWVPPETGLRALVANVNPFTHYINIVRDTALHNEIPTQSWLIVGIITISLIFISFYMFTKARQKIVYWL